MGKAGRDATAAVDVVAALVDGFDPELMGPRDAMDLVEVFSRIEHLASAGVALAARRVAGTDLWRRRGGHRSAAHWLAQVTGMGVGDAVKLLETAEAVENAPDTRDALKAGAVSTRQAKAIGRAETADPDAGKRLLAEATTQVGQGVGGRVGAGGAGRVARVGGGAGRAGPSGPVLPHLGR